MTDELKKKYFKKKTNICEECHKEDISVSQNFILIGFKICDSCKLSKTVYPF